MKKYIITIVDLTTKAVDKFTCSTMDVELCIAEELGGWPNIQKHAMTSQPDIDDDNYQMAGVTKDKTKMFSILCYNAN